MTIIRLAVAALAALSLSACATYDTLSNSDAISPGFGNAVKSNIVLHTMNPHNRNSYNVSGLGADGVVVPALSGSSGSGRTQGGPCMTPDDIARDGSRCGDRAASEKPGGL